MMTGTNVWGGDWRARVLSRLRSFGCADVTEFLARCPGEPYVEMARKLGDDVAALHLEWMHFEEADDERKIRAAALDSLVRELSYHLPDGWRCKAKEDFNTAGVLVDWSLRIEQRSQAHKAKATAVWAALESIGPPIGWLPKDLRDEIILKAFEAGWPELSASAADSATD